MIEQLEDIIEEIANKLYIYGTEHEDGECKCRMCFVMSLCSRIRTAVDIERRLEK
jgi:hypothetical protein